MLLTAAVLMAVVWMQEAASALPGRDDVEKWLGDGAFQSVVETLRTAEDGDSWTLEIDRASAWCRKPGLESREIPLEGTSYGEAVLSLMSEYRLNEITVACDAGRRLAVTFGQVRYDHEDYTRDGVFLIWIDPGYEGNSSEEPGRTLNDGYVDKILRFWPAEEQSIRENWYFWSVSGEPTC